MALKMIRPMGVEKAKVGTGAILCLLLLGGMGCEQLSMRHALDVIRARGELRVLTRSDATSSEEEPGARAGFEYELAKAFADHLGVRLKLVFIDRVRDMVPALLRGEADIIAAGLAMAKHLGAHVAFGPPYLEVTLEVVGRRGGHAPRATADLIGQPLWVHAGTVEEELLKEQKTRYSELSWRPVSEYAPEELLEMVSKGIIPLTIANSHMVASRQRYYPHLVTYFPISERQSLAWAMNPRSSQLQTAVNSWFKKTRDHDTHQTTEGALLRAPRAVRACRSGDLSPTATGPPAGVPQIFRGRRDAIWGGLASRSSPCLPGIALASRGRELHRGEGADDADPEDRR